MILEAVRDHHGLTQAARARALILGREGYIDQRGTWTLTAKGKRYLSGRKGLFA